MPRPVLIINEHLPGLNPIQFGSENCEPGHFFGPAVRTYWLLHFINSGKGSFTRGGREYHLQTGEIFVIPPYMETYYEADMLDPWNYTWIGFTADIKLPEALDRPVVRCREARRIFEEMQLCSMNENGSSMFLCGCLWKLMSCLRSDSPNADYVLKAQSLMQAEYMHGISVQEIANYLNLNRSYFTTLFKERTGVSPGRYLLQLRLDKAIELMTVYREPPATAAASVGYTDICQFSRIFKNHYGVSPRAYLKRLGQE